MMEHKKRDVGRPMKDNSADSGCTGISLWVNDDEARDYLGAEAATTSAAAAASSDDTCVFEGKLYWGPEQTEKACEKSKLDHDIIRLSNLLEKVLQKPEAELETPSFWSALLKSSKTPKLDETPPWEDTTKFSPAWLAQIKEHHKKLAHLITDECKPWLEYVHVLEDVPQSFLRCRFCYSYVQTKPSNRPSLRTNNGKKRRFRVKEQ
jgi:hypothetical protein